MKMEGVVLTAVKMGLLEGGRDHETVMNGSNLDSSSLLGCYEGRGVPFPFPA